jgi:hypothetical protein
MINGLVKKIKKKPLKPNSEQPKDQGQFCQHTITVHNKSTLLACTMIQAMKHQHALYVLLIYNTHKKILIMKFINK